MNRSSLPLSFKHRVLLAANGVALIFLIMSSGIFSADDSARPDESPELSVQLTRNVKHDQSIRGISDRANKMYGHAND
jgi:hypothetical protein